MTQKIRSIIKIMATVIHEFEGSSTGKTLEITDVLEFYCLRSAKGHIQIARRLNLLRSLGIVWHAKCRLQNSCQVDQCNDQCISLGLA